MPQKPKKAPPSDIERARAVKEATREIVNTARAALHVTSNADGEVYIVRCAEWDALSMAVRKLDIAEGIIDENDMVF